MATITTDAPAILTNVTIAQAKTQYPPLVAYVFQRVLENQPGAVQDLTTYLGNKLEEYVGKGFDGFKEAFNLDDVTERVSEDNREKWRIFLDTAAQVITGGQRCYDEDGGVLIVRAQAAVPTR
jgi:hypothetical protein